MSRCKLKKEEKGVKMIIKEKQGWKVFSKLGKNMGGPYKTRKEAEKRLNEVEMFKHMKKGGNKSD